MKKQNLLILVLSLGAVFAISSCNNNSNSNSSVEDTSSSETTSSSSNVSSEATSSDETSSSEGESSSSSKEESSSVVETKYMIAIQYGEAYDNETETLECKDGDIIDLSNYSNINSDYECLGWSDGTNDYQPNDKVTVHGDMLLTGNFVKVTINYTLSEDETYYIVSRIADATQETIEIPATYKGLPVKEIAGDAFSFVGSESATKELVVGENIETINKGAFASLQALEKITVPFFGENLDDETSTFGYLFGASMPQMNGLVTPKTLKEVTITKQEVISQRAFDGIVSIETVTLKNAKTINSSAFSSITSLKTVNLNEGLLAMEANSFSSLSNLTALTIPSTLEKYNNAISGTGITSLHFGASLKEYRNRNESAKLTSITVDEGNPNFASVEGIMYTKDMTTLLTYPARKDITSFKIPDSVTKVGLNAFMYAQITSVDLNRVEEIEDEAFRYSKLTSVTFPDTIKMLGKTSFSATPLTSVHFPEALKNAQELVCGEFLFSSCSVLKEITIPAYIVDIPRFFAAIDSLEKITFLGSVKSIEEKAFAGAQIEELDITFKDSAKIGNNIFMNCGNLSKVNIHFEKGVTNYPTLTETGFYTFIPTFVCDSEEIAAALKESWPRYATFITAGVVSPFVIENNVLIKFNGTKDDKNVVIPDGVTKIATRAFAENTFINSVVIPESIVGLEADVFKGCTNLRVVEFLNDFPGTDIKYVDSKGEEYSFSRFSWNNSRIIFLAKNNTAKNDLMNNSSFVMKKSTYLKDEVVISENKIVSSDGATLIRGYVGEDGTFEIPSGVKNIADYCFYDESNLTTLNFNGIERIGNNAFVRTSFVDLVFPESVVYIGENTFFEVKTLVSIKIEGAAAICDYAFDTCSALETINLGDKVISIGQGSFANAGENNGIVSVILPASLETLSCEAFADCYVTTIYCRFSEEYGVETFEDFEYFVSDYGYEVVFNYTGE